MSDPFDSSNRKVEWARKHIAKLEWEIRNYLNEYPCESFSEPHANKPDYTVQKIRLSRCLPADIPLIAGDAVDNLRAALDHAVYAIAVASGRSGVLKAHFPFAGTVERFEDQLKGRCADVPKEVWPLLRTFQPYRGGNAILFALNEACNRNKHALIVPVGGIANIINIKMKGTGGHISVPTRHVWDRTKNEMELFTEGPGVQRNGHFDFRFLVALADVPGFADEQAFTVLYTFASEVERVVMAIKSELHRLKITP